MILKSEKAETIKIAALLALFGLMCCLFIYQAKSMKELKKADVVQPVQ